MSARRFRTAIMLAAMLGPAVPSTAQDAGRSTSASATDTGDAFYCGERRLGYWFYCVRPKPSPPQTTEPKPQAPTATAALDAITATLRELKARAIIEPTPANVTAYRRPVRSLAPPYRGCVGQAGYRRTQHISFGLAGGVNTAPPDCPRYRVNRSAIPPRGLVAANWGSSSVAFAIHALP